jgi:hypothetical protein
VFINVKEKSMIKIGRPKTDSSSLLEAEDNITEELGIKGASYIEIRVALGCISDDLWHRLIN